MKNVGDVMHQRFLKIYNGMKAAIESGDQEAFIIVWEDKAMLSILRK